MIFETKRLIIRELSEQDLEGFHDLQSNPRVMEYTNGKVLSLQEDEAELRKLIGMYAQPDNNFWVWAMERKTDAHFIGTCALVLNEAGEQEIGYRIREQFWNQGYGTEITGQLIRYVFETLQLQSLVAYVFPANAASVSILERFMPLEKEFYNEAVQSMDRKYTLTIGDYRKRQSA